MKPVPVAALFLLLSCGGCSVVLDENSGIYATQPGKYDYLDCAGITQRAKTFADREAQLTDLIERASQGTGGAVVGNLVYKDELNITRAERRALQKASDDKRCVPIITPTGAQAGAGRPLY